ncbi:CHY zinc finger protein [Galbitalea soli]|uniref:CHY-type domain-containing protein n=1 Tax=Galbitalea soli TaxID=1268042 RepID=A0A7C9TPT6_9MICO|nr:hypothetical protein [Galbitalea soli]NYJ29644.1 putative CHY-type Zn-finger protein [Galbitalea soli]
MSAARPIVVHGPTVDEQTRCVHYATALDVVAIRFFCCDRYYPCHLCHAESETHAARVWPLARRAEPAILCGVCRSELSIERYLEVDGCPACAAPFNPGCRLHSHLYFEVP